MSRHRAVRNLNIQDELDDDAGEYDDELAPWDDMTPEQQDQMEIALATLASLVPASELSLVSTSDQKAMLWDAYFDAHSVVPDVRAEAQRKKAQLAKQQEKSKAKELARASSAPGSARNSRPATPTRASTSAKVPGSSGGRPAAGPVSALRSDVEALGLDDKNSSAGTSASSSRAQSPLPVVSISKERILEEVRAKEADTKPGLSLVVVGHVDAGKSTLMGRLLHELGVVSDKTANANERASQRAGKASFAHAWALDATEEERSRGVTIDVALDAFETTRRAFTLIDAPGHRDFVPNMISGASMADAAVLVVDGASGAFERGFGEDGQGQTREHALLVRSLGVQQLVVAVNKLDAVSWSQARFEEICARLQPFLTQQIGFSASKLSYVPVGAMSGENVTRAASESALKSWYKGPTLVNQLDALDVPPRALEAPLRIPVANVFKGSTTSSGLAVAGRVESGIVQTGERLAVLPGSEAGTVRAIEVDGSLVPYAIAGANATVFLSNIDPIHLSVGTVLSLVDEPVPVVSAFTAQLIIFDIKMPLLPGASVELFHHSADVPATITKLDALLDKTTGEIVRANPRMLVKNTSGKVTVHLRQAPGAPKPLIALETFASNKALGRVLLRRNGETVAGGIVLDLL